MDTKSLYILLSLLFLPLFFTPVIKAQTCDPPCQNSGMCKVNNACQCANNGWTGARCEVALCPNRAWCRTGVCVAPDVCNCAGTGYTGEDCSIPICNNTCLNNGTCVGPDTCDCTGTGYTGALCEVPICNAPLGCGPGNCIAPEVCNCTQGWTGKYCTQPICNPPCEHGGLCYGPNACDCTHTNYTDALCHTPLCDPPCQNEGTCIAPNMCNCTNAVGWTGDQCQLGICSQKCLHGGFCSAPEQCNCENTGYAGDTCEVDINECLQTTPVCDARTTCINTAGSFNCTPCPRGFFGTGRLVDGGCFTCTPSCVHGQCVASNRCNCTTGYTGMSCDIDIDECKAIVSPCDPLTQCINTEGSFNCTACPDGYVGTGLTGCKKADSTTESTSGSTGSSVESSTGSVESSTTSFTPPTANTGVTTGVPPIQEEQDGSSASMLIVGHYLVALIVILAVHYTL